MMIGRRMHLVRCFMVNLNCLHLIILLMRMCIKLLMLFMLILIERLVIDMFGFSFMNYMAVANAVYSGASLCEFVQCWYNVKYETLHVLPYGVYSSFFSDSNMLFLGFSR